MANMIFLSSQQTLLTVSDGDLYSKDSITSVCKLLADSREYALGRGPLVLPFEDTFMVFSTLKKPKQCIASEAATGWC